MSSPVVFKQKVVKEKVLITGGSGYFGMAMIDQFTKNPSNFTLVAGVRDLYKCRRKITNLNVEVKQFDFFDPSTYESALTGIDRLVIVRPPALKDFRKYIFPLIDLAAAKNIKHIVFLSVANLENNKILPHKRIENHIIESGISYTFLRAGFFMQNIARFHGREIAMENRMAVPTGAGKANFTDMRDVAEAANIVLTSDSYFNQTFEVTGPDALTFMDVAEALTKKLERTIAFIPTTGIKFIRNKRHEGVSIHQIILMGAVYAYIKSGRDEFVSDDLATLLGRPARTIQDYISDYEIEWAIN